MNELNLTNTQALIFSFLIFVCLIYLNHRYRKKSVQIERENRQMKETPSEDLRPDYGRYIQLAGVKPWR